jgi:tRNA threonylcarbamoyladenosine biosynthesis protein TsaB
MLILTIRTDKPEAEIGLYEGQAKLKYEIWTAHRQLAETLHTKIRDLLKSQSKDWEDIEAIVCFKGPGSFTGLRIGLTVANALAESQKIPVVGMTGQDWITNGIAQIIDGQNDKQITPEYGSPAHITLPKTK